MRNQIIDNLRGICMLGVIAIHVGSSAAKTDNFTLYMFLEILSRYSIPTFFFISGYGLFLTDKAFLTGGALDYKSFIFKRLKGAGLPYIAWSILYLAYFDSYLPPGWISWGKRDLAFALWFGTCCYHLYFMVILLWFYAFYPVWRKLLKIMQNVGWKTSFVLLFIFQLAFNYASINISPTNLKMWPEFLRNMYNFRLNYVPFHYIFVFMAGGFVSLYWDECKAWLKKNFTASLAFFILAVVLDVGSCWYYKAYKGYNLEALANTFHQLSPQGLVYTIAAIIFFSACLVKLEDYECTCKLSSFVNSFIIKLSGYATLMYYCHPLLLDRLELYSKWYGIVPTSKRIIAAYFLLVLASFILSYILKQIFKHCKPLSILFTGK
ncbi:MAG: acyltransferase [Phascolarctobacterium sp.]|nr:acyltransferase [Phascolarctobacterium sp.]